jgi:hypothetical protein
MKRSLLLLGVIAALAIGAPAYSQYIYLDANGDGVCTSADALSSSSTSVDVWLDSDHDAGGALTPCSDGFNPNDIGSYDLIFRSSGSGSVTFTGYTHNAALGGSFVILNPFTVAGNEAGVGYTGATYLSPGLYKLGTLDLTVTGTPVVGFLGESDTPAIPSPVTGFGSHCSGTTYPNTITLGVDFTSVCGTASPTPTESTTWGKIKQLYR